MLIDTLKKYILPSEINFINDMQRQSASILTIINYLNACFILKKEDNCELISKEVKQAFEIRTINMNHLLNAFITPIDRESIYRVITQLDSIAVSIKHFLVEAKAYNIHVLDDGFIDIFNKLLLCANALNSGFLKLGTSNELEVIHNTQMVRDSYDALVNEYVIIMARLAKSNDMADVFIHRELLIQLREIGKRLQGCANSLEDIVIKMR